MERDKESREAIAPAGEREPSRRNFLSGTLALGGAAACLGAADPAMAAESAAAVSPRLFSYVGGKSGRWAATSARAITGEPLPAVERIDMVSGAVTALPQGAAFCLRGVTTNERYSSRSEKTRIAIQLPLGRPDANHGAFIPIRKNAKWWALTQDERRAIFQERSKHIDIGFKYLPAIARRLNHCRDLGTAEPFDFLTIFDYPKSAASAFDDLMAELRATEEWKYVDREYDIRLVRIDR